ncbi:AraC family ligand binding domain-containing protein [Streptomyces sp. KL116D]|uniref:AraC family ligand binding domain-containing protein n=1 Tax=Streptomyces sp. KL116D TaxID=3045152 RepID=UPI0035564961
MQNIRHTPVAPTRTQRLTSGGEIDAHRHDDHQIVYASHGIIAITTDAGSWVAPATRALWIPAGTVHRHQAHGELRPPSSWACPPRRTRSLDAPTVLSVSPLRCAS